MWLFPYYLFSFLFLLRTNPLDRRAELMDYLDRPSYGRGGFSRGGPRGRGGRGRGRGSSTSSNKKNAVGNQFL